MKFRTIFLLPILVIVLASCGKRPAESAEISNQPSPVEDAFKVCQAFTNTGLTTECDVGGFESTIDVRMDMNSEEARKTCIGAVELVSKKIQSLSGRWKLRIFSPYSGEHPIATCPF